MLVHSDQGSQFTSIEWASFLKHHDLPPSMSRRGNCHDNAVTESFFNLLKHERIRRKVCRMRDEARRHNPAKSRLGRICIATVTSSCVCEAKSVIA